MVWIVCEGDDEVNWCSRGANTNFRELRSMACLRLLVSVIRDLGKLEKKPPGFSRAGRFQPGHRDYCLLDRICFD